MRPSFIASTAWDHPRVCGKDALILSLKYLASGSPPRVREGQFVCNVSFCLHRITPACAGRTSKYRPDERELEDHPRVCGKDYHREDICPLLLGSPPRVREGQTLEKGRLHTIRITPACAGRTRWNSSEQALKKDHPRVCGKD